MLSLKKQIGGSGTVLWQSFLCLATQELFEPDFCSREVLYVGENLNDFFSKEHEWTLWLECKPCDLAFCPLGSKFEASKGFESLNFKTAFITASILDINFFPLSQ